MTKKMVQTLLCALLLVMLLPVCTALGEFKMPVADGNLSVYEGLDENVMNILLVGTNALPNKQEEGRAELFMICSINKETGKVNIISLAGDTYVTVGDAGLHKKLSEAYTLGGVNLLMQTVNRTYNLNIERYVRANFYGLCDVVDALGGVTVQLEKEEAWAINQEVKLTKQYGDVKAASIPKGAAEAKLCGAQALAYMRTLKLGNDLDRQTRQQKVLAAMMREIKNGSVEQMVSLLTTCFRYVTTNLSLTEMTELATKAMSMEISDISMSAFPAEGEFQYDRSNGVSKLIVDQAQGIRKIHSILYAESAAN